jgi:Holliday junction resolvase-like predicted endonuclease
MPEINKSSRHSKITGDFAEGLVLYWLSKHGFESARVDHTGIDLIARNPLTNELMGISVKSRSRQVGTEKDYLGIPNDNFDKIDKACKAFGCVPYFAILVDASDAITIFILSKDKLLNMYPMGKTISAWKMGDNYLDQYKLDKDIMIIKFKYETLNWWTKINE